MFMPRLLLSARFFNDDANTGGLIMEVDRERRKMIGIVDRSSREFETVAPDLMSTDTKHIYAFNQAAQRTLFMPRLLLSARFFNDDAHTAGLILCS